MRINVKNARSKLSLLLDRVEEGEVVIITRHGKEAAQLVQIKNEIKKLPALGDFRSSIKITGEPVSTTVIKERENERY